jgi:hypothetical protein
MVENVIAIMLFEMGVDLPQMGALDGKSFGASKFVQYRILTIDPATWDAMGILPRVSFQ